MEEDGVWRTISGRRVFIRVGQSLTDAMRESGKYGKAFDVNAEEIDPIKIETVNPITDYDKYNALVYDFEENGYDGRPILVMQVGDGYQALTGSHRIFAAREAGIDIPAKVMPINEELYEARDDGDRLRIAKRLYKSGKIDKDAYNLIKYETLINDGENYDASQIDIIKRKADLRAEKVAIQKAEQAAADAARAASKKATDGNAPQVSEYQKYQRNLREKYGDRLWSDMTDREMGKLEDLERAAYKGS